MIVQVIVDIPAMQVNRTFDYLVPEHLQSLIQLGMRVQVPFGKRQLLGFIVGIQYDTYYNGKIKPIQSLMDYESYLSEELLELSAVLAERLQAFRITILQAMLPAMLKVKYRNVFVVRDTEVFMNFVDIPQLRHLVEIDKADLEASLSPTRIKALLDDGVLELEYRVEDRTTVKYTTFIQSAQSHDQLQSTIAQLDKRAKKLKQLCEFLLEHEKELFTYSELSAQAGISQATIKSAIDKGILVTHRQQVYRDPLAHYDTDKTSARTLTPSQQTVYHTVMEAMQQSSACTFLLEGVTGSGKTEVYLQWLSYVRQQGKSGLLLVPEIALTPQMVQQVKARFQEGIAVLHSGLSTSEKYDEWQRIIRGEATIVVGARSSVFAPLQHLGIIIIDEEHETTYKQTDNPRYHARDVAIWRSEYHQCPLILGSATPSLETRSRAKVGKYQWLKLPQRVNQTPLPPVQLVDMTKQLVTMTDNELSTILQDKIADRLNKHEQIVLLLNRRGYASYMQCRACGHVFQCRKCDISLTYHKAEHRLKCHYCDYYESVPQRCPHCHSEHLRTSGLGTQKVAETLAQLYPQARVIRMDVDTTRKKGEHERLLNQFANGEANILLGTQMIAKGLDFEKVTLVGVINADTSLNLPDFRAAEKTFQLLTQVAGRTGRGRYRGEVIIQTYNPDHYIMQFAQQHDYDRFFYYEMQRRHIGNYPPYYFTTSIHVSSKKQSFAQQMIYEIKSTLYDEILDKQGTLIIVGPSRGSVAKINEHYHFQLLLKYKNSDLLAEKFATIRDLAQQSVKQGVYISIDHEPL